MEWLRLDVGFMRHPKIGAFARAADLRRDAAVLAVLRLLCWAAQSCEDGDLSGVHPDDVADAMELRGPGDRIVEALVVSGWLDRDGDRLTIHGWMERQAPLLAGRDRVRRFRERKREEADAERYGNATCNVTGNVTDTLPVTLQSRYCNDPLPTDLPNTTTTAPDGAVSAGADPRPPAAPPAHPPIEDLGDLWRTRCPSLPVPLRWTDRRRKAWAARCRQPGWLDALPQALDAIEASAFCRGDNSRGWTADVDWLLRPDTATRLLEGKYAHSGPAEAPRGSSRGDRASADRRGLSVARSGQERETPIPPAELLGIVRAAPGCAERGSIDTARSYVGCAIHWLDAAYRGTEHEAPLAEAIEAGLTAISAAEAGRASA